MRWMPQIPRERLFVVEVHNDRKVHVALGEL